MQEPFDCGIGLASLFGYVATSSAQQNAVTAIDVALEPDATMIQHAKANNARLLKAYPKGFALDATHNPHITLLQQFVRTADLDKVYAEFMRPWTERVYGVPPEQVVGSSIKTTFQMRDGRPELFRLPEVNFIDDR